MKTKYVFFIILGLSNAVSSHAKTGIDCRIIRPEWSEQDEKNYQDFVARIGQAVEQKKCGTVDGCMKSPANIYRSTDPAGLKFENDCGRLSPALRAYFACKNGLPFSLVTSVAPRDLPGNDKRDIRYNRWGNRVTSRKDVITKKSTFRTKYPSIQSVLHHLVDHYYTASYRIYYGDTDKAPFFADYYPVDITRDAVRPGTVIYDPNGHVVTVYRVEDDGRVRFIDSHPDNSLTAGTYGKQFVRSNPGQGAGFKYWRPLKLVNATRNNEGAYVGGNIIGALNSKLPFYSTVQFLGTTPPKDGDADWKAGTFEFDGQRMDFYSWVRSRLSRGNLRLQPRNEMRNRVADICEALQDRVEAVNIAVTAGVNNQAHPARLPDNIYGTSGDWETYSSPSRDARLKVAYLDLIDQSKQWIAMWKSRDPRLDYSGANLAQDVLDVYQSESRSCQIQYRNSVGTNVTLNLDDIRKRLFKLSFDPYHCAELRWGAVAGREASTCRDDSNKRLWFEREQFLRNQPDRTYDIPMGFSLDELATWRPGNGIKETPDADIVKFLESHK
ncbi:MAG: hypothetical protein AB7H97_03935 [Pseudobdellovibrionaceae bacterium]